MASGRRAFGATSVVLVIIVASTASAMMGAAYLSQVAAASSSGQAPQSTTLPSPSQAQASANLVERDPAFVAAENGTSYQYVSYAGVGVLYRNGTQVEGTLILYFDHCAPGSKCGMIGGPTIVSQLQVYATMAGEVLSIHPITDSFELNSSFGPV